MEKIKAYSFRIKKRFDISRLRQQKKGIMGNVGNISNR
jgi:hypothetical protein